MHAEAWGAAAGVEDSGLRAHGRGRERTERHRPAFQTPPHLPSSRGRPSFAFGFPRPCPFSAAVASRGHSRPLVAAAARPLECSKSPAGPRASRRVTAAGAVPAPRTSRARRLLRGATPARPVPARPCLNGRMLHGGGHRLLRAGASAKAEDPCHVKIMLEPTRTPAGEEPSAQTQTQTARTRQCAACGKTVAESKQLWCGRCQARI